MSRCRTTDSNDDKIMFEKIREKLAEEYPPADEGKFKEGIYTVFYKGVTDKDWDEWKNYCSINDAVKEIESSLSFWKDQTESFYVGKGWTHDPYMGDPSIFFAVFKEIEPSKHHIEGKTRGNILYVDGIKVDLKKSLKIENHSPDGFDWGYVSSGSMQTSLGILAEILPANLARRIHKYFTFDITTYLKHDKDFEFDIEVEKDKIVILESDSVKKDVIIHF